MKTTDTTVRAGRDLSRQRELSQATFARRRVTKAIGELVSQGYRVTIHRDGEPGRTYSPGDVHP